MLSVYTWGHFLTYVYTSQWRPRIRGIGALHLPSSKGRSFFREETIHIKVIRFHYGFHMVLCIRICWYLKLLHGIRASVNTFLLWRQFFDFLWRLVFAIFDYQLLILVMSGLNFSKIKFLRKRWKFENPRKSQSRTGLQPWWRQPIGRPAKCSLP